jgi:ABC-type microcin C transport system duplicated ATPase subunit YejF
MNGVPSRRWLRTLDRVHRAVDGISFAVEAPLRLHQELSGKEVEQRVVEMLSLVGIVTSQ